MPADIGSGAGAYPSLDGLQQSRQNAQPAQSESVTQPTEVTTSVTEGTTRSQDELAAQRQDRVADSASEDLAGTVTADRGQNLNITA